MTELVLNPGVYKQAAENAQPTFQQQFGILTNAILIDKFPAIANYRVAFQLVQKNDQNTRALGVSVNKLDNQFIQVPSFFNKGKIKTGDMMFIPAIQMFRPMSDAWLADVRNMKLSQSGQPMPIKDSDMAQTPDGVRVKQFLDPITKGASLHQPQSTEAVDIFSTALKMGKKASEKLIDTLTTDTGLLNSTLQFYSKQQIVSFCKTAQAMFPDKQHTPKYQCITILDKRAQQLTSDQKSQLYADGYFLRKSATDQDTAPAATVLRVTDFQNAQRSLVHPTQDCLCQLLSVDGSLHSAVVIVPAPVFGHSYGCLRDTRSGDNSLKEQRNTYVVVVPQTVHCKLPAGALCYTSTIKKAGSELDSIGLPLTDAVSDIPHQAILYVPKSGGLVNLTGSFTKNQNDTVWISAGTPAGQWKTICLDTTGKLKAPLLQDKHLTLPINTRIIMPSGYTETGRISIDSKQRRKSSLDGVQFSTIANSRYILQHISKKAYSTVKLYTNGDGFQVSDDTRKDTPSFLGVKQAALHLANHYHIAPNVVKQMLTETGKGAAWDNPRQMSYLVRKQAAEFTNEDQPPNIGATSMQNKQPTVSSIQLSDLQQDPQELLNSIQLATENGIKEVFDVSIIKMLAQSLDISEHVNDYIADFLVCLDKLCRMLFLLYWHGDFMEKKYGLLKLKSLQQAIKNSLDSLSELTVFLKLRGFGGVSSGYTTANSLVGSQML